MCLLIIVEAPSPLTFVFCVAQMMYVGSGRAASLTHNLVSAIPLELLKQRKLFFGGFSFWYCSSPSNR